MAVDVQDKDEHDPAQTASVAATAIPNDQVEDGDASEVKAHHNGPLCQVVHEDDDESREESDDEEDDDEEAEPKLKFTRMSSSLSSLYRNGDSTSALLVAGDKMIIGTHNGNIHVLSLPEMQTLKFFNAHKASVTSISVSPYSPKFPTSNLARNRPQSPAPKSPSKSKQNAGPDSPRRAAPANVRRDSSTQASSLYIATSSIDGWVCIWSLADPKDNILRNFARPVQSVALSPNYASDRMFLSGGLAGNLIVTVGGKAGVRSEANTNSAAAAASGWLGSVMGSGTGSDKILHHGEGAITSISWSHSGKYVAWTNETGIKIMRSSLHLDRADAELAWRRIAHADIPKRRVWEGMSGVWKSSVQWVDERFLEPEDEDMETPAAVPQSPNRPTTAQSQLQMPVQEQARNIVERLLVGWGDTVWVITVRPGLTGGSGPDAAQKALGKADSPHLFVISDGLISGLAAYTPRHVAIIVYRTRDDDDQPVGQENENGKPRRGIRKRRNALPPDLRIVDIGVEPAQEVDSEPLQLERFEALASVDYLISTIFVPPPVVSAAVQRSALSTFGGGLWDVSMDAGLRAVHVSRQATRLFGSGASVLSKTSTGDDRSSLAESADNVNTRTTSPRLLYPQLATPGLKLFVHGPFGGMLAVKRDKADRLQWLLEQHDYAQAWRLVQSHPHIVDPVSAEDESRPSTPSRTSLADFMEDSGSSARETVNGSRPVLYHAAEREKMRIGHLWVQQLVANRDWEAAARTAGQVLGDSQKWEHWIWAFVEAGKFDEISPQIPTTNIKLSSTVYEVVLNHYLTNDLAEFDRLIETWEPGLYDKSSIIQAVRARVASDKSPTGRPLINTLAKLYVEDQQPQQALMCYLQSKNAPAALDIIKQYELLGAVADRVWDFMTVGIPNEKLDDQSLTLDELDKLSHEPIKLVASAAPQDRITVSSVVGQLKGKKPNASPLLFFYFRSLWNGDIFPDEDEQSNQIPLRTLASRRSRFGRNVAAAAHTTAATTRGLLLEHAKDAVTLFAQYSRPLLGDLLRSSDDSGVPLTQVPGFYEHASAECEKRKYTHELVHLLSATGQTRQALHLIIDDIGNVKQAIDFAKEIDDEGLWEDLLDYSMDKPVFVKGLLEQDGSISETFSAQDLVARIPNGLEIPGLKEGLTAVLRDGEIQWSIAEGAAKVLRAEVSHRLDEMMRRRQAGVLFELGESASASAEWPAETSLAVFDDAATLKRQSSEETVKRKDTAPACSICTEQLLEDASSRDSLIGFRCGHLFHLNCVLDMIITPENVDQVEQLQRRLEGAESLPTSGAKTRRAQMIAEVLGLRFGCTVCGDDGPDTHQDD